MKVHIGSAIYRTVEARHHASLATLIQRPGVEYMPVMGDALVERSRCISATYFLTESDADVHLSIDSDITDFDTDAALGMCQQTFKHDIVGGIYVTRNTTRTFPTSMFEPGTSVEMSLDPTPFPVRYVATGFMATHRRVFEKLAEDMPLLHGKDGARAFYPFYIPFIVDDDEGNPILLSEDWAFCHRAKDAGFGTYINPAIRLGHVSQMVFRLEDMFYDPVMPQPCLLERPDNTAKWRIHRSTQNDPKNGSEESRQVRRAQGRKEAKAGAASA
ncbi:hypothetical protein LCGC14_2161900 [marine sediment metagenome]|uniref:Uncharacterized protein n=1 Tax=marine sediment metagenome TaxID=412755 RepID=A0A0F9EEU7_9ZZZZ